MYNKEFIKGLVLIRDGLNDVINSLNAKTDVKATTLETPTEEKVERKVLTATSLPERKPQKEVETTVNFDVNELKDMAYNDLKKLAKDLGVSAAGSRDKIIDRILSVNLSATESVDGETEVEVKEEPKTSKKKVGIKKSAEPVEEQEDTDDEEQGEEVDPVYAEVLALTENMSIDDLGEILSDIGISPKGKRQALVDKIYKAVVDGELSLEDDDEEEQEEDDTSEEDTQEFEEHEDVDVNDYSKMTKERKKACEEMEAEVQQSFKDGELKRADLLDFCIEFYGEDNESELKALEDDDLLDYYIDAVLRMIDDDGELHEEGAYEVNGEYYCCGRPLSYAEDTNKFICEMCGEEYEAE